MWVWVVWVSALGAQGQSTAWRARWIQAPDMSVRDGAEVDGSRPLPIFRREFVVGGAVRRATLRIAGLGQFEAHLGWEGGDEIVGGAGLHQSWTDYRKTVRYETFDLTGEMRAGPMVLAVLLGNGMYNVERSSLSGQGAAGKARYTKFEGTFGPPKMTAELELVYSDGRTETIATDSSWLVTSGPVVFDSIYGGEDYSGGWIGRGWNEPASAARGYEAGDWTPVEIAPPPCGVLKPALAPPVRVQEVYKPVRQTEPVAGKVVYDLGQNFAGIPRIRVSGPAAAELRLTPGELLNADGTVSQRSSGGPMWWSYTLGDGGQAQTWQPKFGYYGFRYLQVEWRSAEHGTVEEVSGLGLHSTSAVTGTFESSSEQLNSTHKLIVAAMHNNEVSIFTDCPHREKLGWLEETQLVADALLFNNDLRGLYAATAANIADAQGADGMVPTIAPQYTKFGPKYPVYDDSPEWGAATVLGPWAVYRFYGERAQLEQSYPVMQRWVAYLAGRAVNGIVAYGLGDWYDIGPGGPGFEKNTTLGVTGTLTLYECQRAMQQMAMVLGRTADAERYGELAKATAEAYNRRFWDAGHGWYDRGSQTANAMPLALGVVPVERREAVLKVVLDDLHAHQDHVTTGEVGYPYLLHLLMASGQDDEVLRMMMRTDAPSYGSQLAAGATSLTEAWDANPANSQDHFMLGAGDEWFYRGLGGIDLDMSRPAGQALVIRPAFVSGVDWVRCGYRSSLGKIESDWRREGNGIRLDLTVPQGVTARLRLTRGWKAAAATGVVSLQQGGAESVLSVGPGVHRLDLYLPGLQR